MEDQSFDFEMSFKQEVDTVEETEIKDESHGSTIFTVIAIGQGGANIAMALKSLGYKMIMLNTSQKDLNVHNHPYKFRVFNELNQEGSGKNPNHSFELFQEKEMEIKSAIRKIAGKNTQHFLICATSSGGCGAGGLIPTIDYAKDILKENGFTDYENRVTVITTLPYNNEINSAEIKENVYSLINKLSDIADNKKIGSLMIIDNEQLHKHFAKKVVARQFLPTVNMNISQLWHIFNRTSALSSEFSIIDQADYHNIIKAGGHLTMKQMTLQGSDIMNSKNIDEWMSVNLIKNIENAVIVDNFKFKTASMIGCVIVVSNSIMDAKIGLMEGFSSVFDTLSSTYSNAKLFKGIYTKKDKANSNPDPNNGSIDIYTIIGGMEKPETLYKKFKV